MARSVNIDGVTMTAERQLNYEISDREVKLYFFTVHEVSSILRCSPRSVIRWFRGKMIWHDDRWMINPSDIEQVRKLHEIDSPSIG